MVISHNPKFLCLNPPKTGTGFMEFVFRDYSEYSTTADEELNRHYTASLQKEHMTKIGLNFDDYYKFCVVRNPWVRAVSFYNMNIKNGIVYKNFGEFIDFLLAQPNQSEYYKYSSKTFDCVCSLENINNDIRYISNILNIDVEEQLDPQYFMSIHTYLYNPNPVDYSKYFGIFTDDLVNKIAEKEKDVIKLKGYECPEEFKPIKITKENFAVIRRDTHIGKWATEHKRLDFDQCQLSRYIKYFKEGDVLVNVGANIGCYAKAFVDKASKIICFEPHEEAFMCLKYNLEKYSNVELYNAALSHDSHMYNVLDGYANNIGASVIESSVDSQKYTMTLDELDFDKLNFILMDCEGSEYNVLLGARNTIDKFKPIIVTEVNDRHLQIFGSSRDQLFLLLDEMGYTYRNIFKGQSLDEVQFDMICFPKEIL